VKIEGKKTGKCYSERIPRSPPEADGVSERTTIKWNHFLTFRRFPAACRSEAEIPLQRGCRELQFGWSGTPREGLAIIMWVG
jgi:hypothetical protein